MTKAYEANLERIRDGLVGLKNEADITKFEPPKERFGDDLGPCKISASKFHRSVASIALFHGDYYSAMYNTTFLQILIIHWSPIDNFDHA
jgi:hypothetical protein